MRPSPFHPHEPCKSVKHEDAVETRATQKPLINKDSQECGSPLITLETPHGSFDMREVHRFESCTAHQKFEDPQTVAGFFLAQGPKNSSVILTSISMNGVYTTKRQRISDYRT